MRHAQKTQDQSVFASSAGGLAASAGIAAAFVAAPQLYALGAGWVAQFGEQHYSSEWGDLYRFGFLGLLAYFIFNLTKLLSYAAITSFGLWLGSVAMLRSRRNLS